MVRTCVIAMIAQENLCFCDLRLVLSGWYGEFGCEGDVIVTVTACWIFSEYINVLS